MIGLLVVLSFLNASVIAANEACVIKPTPPENAVCGQLGTFEYPDPEYQLILPQYGSLETCAEFCHRSAGCGSFSRHEHNGLCRFFDLSYYTNNASSPVAFYDLKCFDCKKLTCPPKSSTNFVQNPGFDLSDKAGPWMVAIDSRFHLGPGGLNSSNAFITRDGAIVYQSQPLCSGEYIAQMHVKVEQLVPSPDSYPVIQYGGDACTGNLNLSSEVGKRSIGKWQILSCPFPGSRSSSVELSVPSLNEQFRVFLDNVSIRKIPDPKDLKLVGKSLIENGDFENGQTKPWKASPILHGSAYNTNLSIASPGIGQPASNYSLKLDRLNSFDNHYEASYGYMYLTGKTSSATDPNKYYLLSFDYKALNVTSFYVSTNSYTFGSHLLRDDYPATLANETSTGTWSRALKGSGKVEHILFEFESDLFYDFDPYIGQVVYLDNVNLYQIADGQIP